MVISGQLKPQVLKCEYCPDLPSATVKGAQSATRKRREFADFQVTFALGLPLLSVSNSDHHRSKQIAKRFGTGTEICVKKAQIA